LVQKTDEIQKTAISRHDICALRENFFEGSQIGMGPNRAVSVDSESDARFDKAFEFLAKIVDLKDADRLHPVRDNAV
jgi:hypothetical protein